MPTLTHNDHEVRIRNAKVSMRGHRLMFQEFDEATEILVDFHSRVAVTEFRVWANTASRLRVDVGGGWLAMGDDESSAADLGAFTAGETKNATIEVMVPSGSGSRHEELEVIIGLGV